MATVLPPPLCPPATPAGFSLVEFLLVAVILAVGLLGLGGLQVAAVRGGAASRSQMVALALAGDALETAAFEAAGAGRGRPGWPGQPRYTGPDTRWISQHDRDGRPVRSSGPGGFSLVLTRTEAMASPEPMERRAAGARAAAGVFRARVTWVEAAPVAPAPGAAAGPGWRERRLALVRLIAF